VHRRLIVTMVFTARRTCAHRGMCCQDVPVRLSV